MKLSSRNSFLLAVALGSFALIGGTGLTVSSAWLITMASKHPPILVLGVSIVLVRFFGIFRSVARYGERVISHEAIFKKLTGIRVKLFNRFADSIGRKSELISSQSKSVIDDVERAQELHLRVTLPGISALVSGFTTLLLAYWIEDFLTLFVAITLVVFSVAIPFFVRHYLDPIARLIEDSENQFSDRISAASHALVEAEIFNYREKYLQTLRSSATELVALERRLFRLTSLLQFLTIFTIGATLVWVSSTLLTKEDFKAIDVSMSIFLILVGFEGFTTWFPNLFHAGKNRRAAESINQILANEITGSNKVGLPAEAALYAEDCRPFWSENFLKPFSIDLTPGDLLVVVGESGVGKSTFAHSLLGLAPYRGSLQIGGVEISEIDRVDEWVSASPQNPYIFNTSLRENLKIANGNLDDIELVSVLEELELEYIPLDEVLGEFGRPISGGEAKRISIARAMLSQAPIVILDEPLEHLDSERAVRVQGSIARLARGRTLIVITHTPWLQYSKILKLERE